MLSERAATIGGIPRRPYRPPDPHRCIADSDARQCQLIDNHLPALATMTGRRPMTVARCDDTGAAGTEVEDYRAGTYREPLPWASAMPDIEE